MRIILVEDDRVKQRQIYDALKAGFPDVEISRRLDSVGLFLLALHDCLPHLNDTNLIVLERHLPLWGFGASEDNVQAAMGQLTARFPEVVADWDCQQGGERLVRWLRKNGVQIPLVFYTHSDESLIADDVRATPGVFYVGKASNPANLIEHVRQFVQAS